MIDYEELIYRICNAEYECRFHDGTKYKSRISTSEAENAAIAKAVYEWGSKNLDENTMSKEMADLRMKNSELEAKIFVYESALKNSNFAAIVMEKGSGNPKDKPCCETPSEMEKRANLSYGESCVLDQGITQGIV